MAGPSLFRPGNITSGLVGYWKLGEASGSRADSSGNGNTLTDNNTVLANSLDYWKTGENSADFESTNSEYLSISNASQVGLGITGSFTMAFWVKLESTAGTFDIMGKWGSNLGYGIRKNAAGTIFQLEVDAGSTNFSNSTLVVGKWYHIVIVFDSVNDLQLIYINGNLDNSVAQTGTVSASVADFRIGDGLSLGTAYYDGLLKDAAIWNVVLTPLQIKSLAMGVDLSTKAFRPSNCGTQPSSWWKLNEISGSRADSIGSNTLTDNNTVLANGGFVEGIAADFEASNSEYLSAGDILDITGDYSHSLWFKPESVNITQVFIGKSDGTNGYQFGLNTSGKMFVKHEGTTYTDTGAALVNGVWYHLSVVFDAAADTVTFYLDGIQNSQVASATVNPTNTALAFHLGRRSSTDYVDGVLADVAIWTSTKILTADISKLASCFPLQQTGFVSYWKLDETSGNRSDSIGSNTLVDTNTVASASGKVGTAADFESTNSEVLTIADASQSGLDLASDYTLMCWVKPESSGSQFFIDKDNDTAGYALQKSAGDAPILVHRNASTVGTTTLVNGTFYHLAGIYDQETTKLFVNSSQEDSDAQTTDPGDNTDAFELGRVNGSSAYYDGLMDEVLIAKRYFRNEEIKVAYTKGLNGFELTSEPVPSNQGNMFLCF